MTNCKAKIIEGRPNEVETKLNAFFAWLDKQEQAEPLTVLQSQSSCHGSDNILVITVIYYIDDGQDGKDVPTGYTEIKR